MKPRISVVIPTQNRADLLRQTLSALGRQTVHPDAYDLVLVADGCTDGTASLAGDIKLPYRITFIEQPALGAAAARNRGAERATAPLLLLLDDDKEPAPGLIAAHLKAHESQPGRVVLGSYPTPAGIAGNDPYAIRAKQWWDSYFAEIGRPEHRFTFKDFCSGNVSLSAELFRSTGGFDEGTIRSGAEDYEFGARLLARGVRFLYLPEALTVHKERRTYDAALRRARSEGYNHALMVKKNFEFFWSYSLHEMSRLQHWPFVPVWRLLWRHPRVADLAAAMIQPLVHLTQRLGMHKIMFRLGGISLGHAYWRGVHDALGSLAAWERLYQDAPLVPEHPREIDLDLAVDFGRLEEIFEERHADAVRLYCNGTPLGRIWPAAGGERLSGGYVRQVAVARFSAVLLGLIIDSHLNRHATNKGPFNVGADTAESSVEGGNSPRPSVRVLTRHDSAVRSF